MALQSSSELAEFQKYVRQYIMIDAECEKYQSNLKILRNKKNDLHDHITQCMVKHNWTDSILDAGNCRLQLAEKKHYSSLSFGYIETSLGEIIHNKDHLQKIMKHLKDNRQQKSQWELKKI